MFKSKGEKNQKPNHPRQQNNSSNKIQKSKGLYYVCGKSGHKANQYPLHEGQSQPNQKLARQPIAQANLAEDSEIIYAVIKEVNLVTNSAKWIDDTGTYKANLC